MSDPQNTAPTLVDQDEQPVHSETEQGGVLASGNQDQLPATQKQPVSTSTTGQEEAALSGNKYQSPPTEKQPDATSSTRLDVEPTSVNQVQLPAIQQPPPRSEIGLVGEGAPTSSNQDQSQSVPTSKTGPDVEILEDIQSPPVVQAQPSRNSMVEALQGGPGLWYHGNEDPPSPEGCCSRKWCGKGGCCWNTQEPCCTPEKVDGCLRVSIVLLRCCTGV